MRGWDVCRRPLRDIKEKRWWEKAYETDKSIERKNHDDDERMIGVSFSMGLRRRMDG